MILLVIHNTRKGRRRRLNVYIIKRSKYFIHISYLEMRPFITYHLRICKWIQCIWINWILSIMVCLIFYLFHGVFFPSSSYHKTWKSNTPLSLSQVDVLGYGSNFSSFLWLRYPFFLCRDGSQFYIIKP